MQIACSAVVRLTLLAASSMLATSPAVAQDVRNGEIDAGQFVRLDPPSVKP